MKHIFKYICLLGAALAFSACHEPEYKVPDDKNVTIGITSMTAKFLDDDRDENEFKSEIDAENHRITIVFPYTYPAMSDQCLTEENLKNVKVSAMLDDNCYIEPALLFMDLSIDNLITIIDQAGNRTDWTVRGEIRKSSECFVTSFRLPEENIKGVINDNDGLISIIGSGISPQIAEVELSFGASITGPVNPATTVCTYDEDGFTFTVLAQDGKTSKDYSVKCQTPAIIDKGARPNSGKILWNVKLKENYSLESPLLMNSIAVLKDYIVLNTRNRNLLVVSRSDGAKVGEIALPFLADEAHPNFKITSDSNDNILVTNLSNTTIKVYRIKGVEGTPELYLTFDTGGNSYGRAISVVGSLDSDAVITMPAFETDWIFRRWEVKGGVLNTAYEEIALSPEEKAGNWVYNCDIIPTDPSDLHADFFLTSYAQLKPADGSDNRGTLWFDGSSNKVRCHTPYASSNWVRNAGDYVNFNGVGYLAVNSVNSFTWGLDDLVWVYDLSDSNLDNQLWKSELSIYGSFATIGEANGNATGDCALTVSEDGFFMYLYFFFSGGQMVAVQFDCLNM